MPGPPIVFLESNTSGTGQLFLEIAAELGFEPVMVTARRERYPFLDGMLDRTEVRVVEVADSTRVDELLAVLADRIDGIDSASIAGVTSTSEYSIADAAEIARVLGLPGPDPEAVRRCRDKGRQRRALEAAGVAQPRFLEVRSLAEAGTAVDRIGLPVVVKPVAESGSVGVRLCRDRDAALAHAETLLSRGEDDRGRPVEPRVLVEALAEGPEYSVEVFDGAARFLSRKTLGPPPAFVEVGHDLPATFPVGAPGDPGAALMDCAEAAVRALGLGFGPVHAELRLAPAGPVVIEINPRLAGGFIPEMVRLATGVDLVRATVERVVGRHPDLAVRERGAAAIRFLVAPFDGELGRADGLDLARAVDGIADARLYRREGDSVVLRGDFKDRIGHLLASGATPDAVERALTAARAALRLEWNGAYLQADRFEAA